MLNVTLDESIFGVESLTGLVRSFMEEPGARVCTDLFRSSAKKLLPEGSSVTWEESQLSRHLAPVTGRDSPHQQVQVTNVIPRASAMAHMKIYKDLPAGMLLDRRAPGSMSADERYFLNEALMDLAKMLNNSIELMCAQLLSTGSITVTTAIFPGSTITFTVTFTGFNTYVVTASWATAATKILSSELILAERDFRAESGLELGRVIHNAGVKQNLLQNTEIKELLVALLGPQLVQGGPRNLGPVVPALQLGGYDWQQADGVYKPEGGAATRYWADKKVAFLPRDLSETLALAEGHGYVPGTTGQSGPAPGAGLVRKAPSRGAYAYAAVNLDVPSVRVYAGWVGLPILLTPQNLMICADVETP